MKKQGPIVVFGEALVDDFITEQVVGGAPFNVARNLAAFDHPAQTITRIGRDPAGALIRAEFDRFGLAQTGLQVGADQATGRVVVERANGQHSFHICADQAYDHIDGAAAVNALGAIDAPSAIYFGTLAQRGATSRAALQRLLAASDAPRYVDLNMRQGQVTEACVAESLRHADILKVNEDELQALFGWFGDAAPGTADMADGAVHAACQDLVRRFGLQSMIVTLGERGAVCFDAVGSRVDSPGPATPLDIVDTVGAGDAFSSVFLLGRWLGWPLDTILARANEFAGAICGISGAVPADLAFYQPFITRWLAGAGDHHGAA